MDLREQYIKEKGYSNFNNTVLNEYTLWLENKITDNAQALQLQQTGVSGSTYAIYYEFNGMKMWLSPKDSRFTEYDNKEDYTCVSHPYTRFTFSEKQLSDKILELTKKHPTNVWLYAVVE